MLNKFKLDIKNYLTLKTLLLLIFLLFVIFGAVFYSSGGFVSDQTLQSQETVPSDKFFLEKIYGPGVYDTSEKSLTWPFVNLTNFGVNQNEGDLKKLVSDWGDSLGAPYGDDLIISKVVFTHLFGVKDQVNKYLVLTKTKGSSCEEESICQAVLGAAIFSNETGEWKLVSTQKFAGYLGDFSTNPEMIKLGPAKEAVGFKTRYRHVDLYMGHKWELLNILGFIDEKIKPVLRLDISGINSGVDVADDFFYSYDPVISLVPKENYEYFDILVTSNGTKLLDGKVKPFNDKKLYRFENGVYSLVEKSHPNQTQGVMSPDRAMQIVNNLPEVKEWKGLFSNSDGTNPKTGGKPVIFIGSTVDNLYFVHVYEDIPDHRATFGWYVVDKNTGKALDRI